MDFGSAWNRGVFGLTGANRVFSTALHSSSLSSGSITAWRTGPEGVKGGRGNAASLTLLEGDSSASKLLRGRLPRAEPPGDFGMTATRPAATGVTGTGLPEGEIFSLFLLLFSFRGEPVVER